MIDYEKYRDIMRVAGRKNFWAFCCYMDYDFFQNRNFLKEPAMLLQNLYEKKLAGTAISVGISMPPRAGKSYLISMFCAWILGMLPNASIMRNTCTATLYEKLSYDTRAIVNSEKYRSVFPAIKLSDNKKNVSGWNTNKAKQVSYFGAGVGGTIIGFGTNIAINDDLYKSMLDALSDTTNEKTKMWKQSAHDSRKEKHCPEIYIGTRWTLNDVIGEALESGKIKPENYVCIPALVEKDGKQVSFCEHVKTTEEYLTIKNEIEESVWEAEYMQNPIEVKGLLFPKSELRFANISNYDLAQSIWRVAVGDPADRGGDYYAMPFAYLMPDFDVIIKDIICNKDGIEANTARVIEKSKLHRLENVIIEANGGWIGAVKMVRDGLVDTDIRVSPYKNTIDKLVRILANYEFVKKHFVFDENYLRNSEYAAFMNNLMNFKKEGVNSNDDPADVLAALSNMIKIKFRGVLYG